MSEWSNESSEDHVWRIQVLAEQSTRSSTKTVLHQSLSFLSLAHAHNLHPDTGESGDAYDVEVSVDR
jgi:hypothetical protein